MTSKTSWVSPLLFAAALRNEDEVSFLFFGTSAGKKSVLAWSLESEVNVLDKLENKLNDGEKWFGYFGYGLKNQLEDLPKDSPAHINFPELRFCTYKNILEFDHELETIEIIKGEATEPLESFESNISKTSATNSNMSDDEYMKNVEGILERIKAGDLYQANLTRKFFGEFDSEPCTFSLFYQLTQTNPAEYSAFIKSGEKAIISSSPEQFLSVEDGIVETKPIKGTLSSALPAEQLENSEKDKAENLMIVDLMRNDLSRSCSKVEVTELFKVLTHKNYHHMHSTIRGKMNSNLVDLTKSCFPPGSMTGAPKIEAMKLCSKLEKQSRGVYSGALGWIEGNNADFSVVIRTLLVDGKKFEYQAGGGIVADSKPQKELEEMYLKVDSIKKLIS